MLDRAKPDGAIVAVPNQMHVAVGLACIARKVPIIIEKPIADDVASALDLVEAAEKAGVPTMVGHHRRHNPIMRKAAEIIAGGGIGRVVAVNGLWLSHKPDPYFNITWRKEPGGGPVLINAIHDIDCLRMLCGDIETVNAATGNAVRKFDVEDTAAAVLQFKSGALGTLLVSDTVSSPFTWEWGSRENPNRPNEPENCYSSRERKGRCRFRHSTIAGTSRARRAGTIPCCRCTFPSGRRMPIMSRCAISAASSAARRSPCSAAATAPIRSQRRWPSRNPRAGDGRSASTRCWTVAPSPNAEETASE